MLSINIAKNKSLRSYRAEQYTETAYERNKVFWKAVMTNIQGWNMIVII